MVDSFFHLCKSVFTNSLDIRCLSKVAGVAGDFA